MFQSKIEFVWKYLNKESISNFEIIEIPELDKLEIIDNNTLDVKEEYIETLIEIFIKGKEIVEEIPKEMKKTKKKSKLPLLITLIFIGGIVGGIIYLRNNPELIYGKNIYVECKKKYEISELTVNSSELVTLTFNNSQILTKHEKVITYIFDDSDNYYDFKERNLQYQYLNDSGLENFDESTLNYQLYVDYDLGKIYTLPRDYDELYDYYKNNGYSCNNIEK